MRIEEQSIFLATATTGAQELYDRLTSSQGNTVQTETSSSRYTATSSVRVGSGSTSSSSGSESDSSKSNVVTTTTGSSTSSSGSSSSSSSRTSSTNSTTGGPNTTGSAKYIEDSQVTGPTVKTVTITEQHFEDFGVYEESMNGTHFFYTTVSNGGITDGNVSIDIPAGVDYVMEKDGVEIPYTNGQIINERGSYILRLTVTEDTSLPFSEQTISKGVFRFRIQDRVAGAQTDEEESSIYGSLYDNSYSAWSDSMNQMGLAAGETPGAFVGMEESAAEDETGMAESETDEGAADEEAADVMGEDNLIDGDRLDEVIQAALGEGYSTEALEYYSAGTGLSSHYDSSVGYYCHELASGEIFYTDVPNGTLTTGSVVVKTNDDLSFRVLKDGEPFEWKAGTAIGEAGSYLIFPYSESAIYIGTYAEENEPLFSFRILGKSVNDLGVVSAPQNGSITEVYLNGEAVEGVSDAEWYVPQEDGEYRIVFETEAGPSEVSFVKDTVAPRFSCSLNGGRALFQYLSDDIVRSRVLQDGETIYDGMPVEELDSPGAYTVEAYDQAGNRSSFSMEIPYQMNIAAILAIVLVVLLLALLAVFVRRIQSQMKVV